MKSIMEFTVLWKSQKFLKLNISWRTECSMELFRVVFMLENHHWSWHSFEDFWQYHYRHFSVIPTIHFFIKNRTSARSWYDPCFIAKFYVMLLISIVALGWSFANDDRSMFPPHSRRCQRVICAIEKFSRPRTGLERNYIARRYAGYSIRDDVVASVERRWLMSQPSRISSSWEGHDERDASMFS